MKFLIFSTSLLVLSLVVQVPGHTIVSAEEKKMEEKKVEKTQVLEDLTSLLRLSEKDRDVTLSRLSEYRVLCRDALIGQLGGKPPSNHHQCSVIFLLGYYRMSEAAPTLAKMITFESEEKDRLDKKLPLWGQYPAAEALTRIGLESTPSVLEQIESTTDELTLKLGTEVIQGLYGSKIAVCVFDQAISSQANPNKKKRLEKAKAAIKGP